MEGDNTVKMVRTMASSWCQDSLTPTHILSMVVSPVIGAAAGCKTPAEFTSRIKLMLLQSLPAPGSPAATGPRELGGELPSRDWIDSVTKNNPVLSTGLMAT